CQPVVTSLSPVFFLLVPPPLPTFTLFPYTTLFRSDRASLTLEAGRICGLVGMNGSGKSTLFKTIMGIVEPDSGQVSINGIGLDEDRKSTRLNSSHVSISYAVFCLKKKKTTLHTLEQ